MTQTCTSPTGPRAKRPGFTLVEILVALAVIGVASSLMFSLFFATMDLADTGRSTKVASALATEQLAAMERAPGAFVCKLNDVPAGSFAPVSLRGQRDNITPRTPPPPSLPIAERAYNREENFYNKFIWEAYARLPREDAAYADVTVVIRWHDKGRERLVTVSSALARTLLEEMS